MEYYFEINGRKIFTEVLGADNAPAILYIHGGPGAGSFDFRVHQGDRLSRFCKLIMVDQRGVLRSQYLEESDLICPRDIVEDFEEIRRRLNIKSWSILGHSFGGYLALLYNNLYPKVIDKIIFECPTFDFALSARSLIARAAEEFRDMGHEEKAQECEQAVLSYKDTRDIWYKMSLLNELGERRNNLYVFHEEKDFFENLVRSSGLSDEIWSREQLHSNKLDEDGSVYYSAMPLLQNINCPALMINGKYDYVTSIEQIEEFRKKVSLGTVIEFNKSGHFPRFEEAELYTETIECFLLKNKLF